MGKADGKHGKTSKDSYELGERVRIQDLMMKQWKKEATIRGIHTAADEVSYDLDLNKVTTAHHTKILTRNCELT